MSAQVNRSTLLRLVTSGDETTAGELDYSSTTASSDTSAVGSAGGQPWQGSPSGAATVTLQQVGSALVLVHPLYVQVEQIGGTWFATSKDLVLVGRGETEFDALDELRAMIYELWESLVEMRDALGPHLAAQLHFLERLEARR